MGAVQGVAEAGDEREPGGPVLAAAPDAVEVRRNSGVAALVGALASTVAIAYLARAGSSGAVLDWAVAAAMALVGAAHLHALVDARTPLLVADAHGVRLRLGRAWRGLPWGALAAIEHTPRHGFLRDGRLVLVPHNTDRVLAELDGTGRRQSRWSRRLHGAPFALPLGLTTRVVGHDGDLTTALRTLAGTSSRVVELVPDGTAPGEPAETVVEEVVEEDPEQQRPRRLGDPRPRLAQMIGVLATSFRREPAADGTDTEDTEDTTGAEDTVPIGLPHSVAPVVADAEVQALAASPTPVPLREPRAARRAEVTATVPVERETVEGRELRRPGSVSLVEDTQVWGDRVRPIATLADAVEPLVIDDFEVQPAADPVIGPELTAARTRIGLTVDRLAERTRIRPHVIESIEVDDFAPCGGDFYARGHLRTLARVLGLDAGGLLATYDERYADAPVSPRRVFEAELATGASGGIRSTRGGQNWSALVAVVMTLVLAWSIARLVTDAPVEIQTPAPILNGSGGPEASVASAGTNVTLKVTAERPTRLVVRNARERVVFEGDVDYGEVHRLDVTAPVTVQAGDAGAVRVAVDGRERGTLGRDGQSARRTYQAD